ncbi:MAG: hypothetical protein V2A66_03185 [Pseudomonadota bacterium]
MKIIDKLSRQEILERVSAVPFWLHSIDVGEGIVTPGQGTPAGLKKVLELMRLPNLKGKTVLDINTWDGYFAFEAERRGADSVTAIDYYVWSMDLGEHIRYWKECSTWGIPTGNYEKMPYYRPEELPGKIGFDTAHALLKSRVKPIVANFMEMDLDALGTFDITFFLGSLYHMHNPFESIKRLAKVTRDLAVIETEAAEFPGFGSKALCEFFEGSELNNDYSTWWAPNVRALMGMCRAAGFQQVELVQGPRIWSKFKLTTIGKNLIKYRKVSTVWRHRAIVHARKVAAQ